MYLDICTAHSVRKKNDLVTEMAWNVTLVSRPVAAPPKTLWSAPITIRPSASCELIINRDQENDIVSTKSA